MEGHPTRRISGKRIGLGYGHQQKSSFRNFPLEPQFLFWKRMRQIPIKKLPKGGCCIWSRGQGLSLRPPGYEGVKTTRKCMTRNDKSTFYQPFSMTLVPMRDTGGHWFLTKVTAPDRQPLSSDAEEGRQLCQPQTPVGPPCSKPRTWHISKPTSATTRGGGAHYEITEKGWEKIGH